MNHAAVRSRDLPSAFLLVLLVAVASQRLVGTDWAPDLVIVFLLALAGTLLGFPLGLSRFSRGTVLMLTLLYSLVVIPFSLAATLYSYQPWLERMVSMGGRLLGSLSVLAAGNPLEDTFLYLLFFSIGFWLIGVSSAYTLTRSSNFLGTILPGVLVLVLLQIFDARGNQGVILTALFIFLMLLLLGRMNYVRRRETWRGWRVFPTGEARTDLNLYILGGAALLVLTAWLLPVSSRHIPLLRVWWQDVSRLWERNEDLTNLFAGLDVDDKSFVNDFYGQYLPLGKEAPTSDAVLFHIQNNGIAGQERYYWRARSYAVYENGLWGNSPDNTRDFTSRSNPILLPDNVGVSVEFRLIVVHTNFGTLITPARPVWVNRPSRLTYLPVDEEVAEPLLFRANEPVQPGEEYLIRALILEPTVQDLRLAGTDYPKWVTDLYLQLPTDLPPAIINLATQIAAGSVTPYDKAEAITAYLRQEITYTSSMEPAPVGRNILTWFLFDYKQGFCNYYATAEVLLLRTVGVPTRLAVGFSEGEYEMPGWYTVRQQDAHAWPEVYFPGIGWVEFEPTASEPELVHTQIEVTGPEVAGGIPLTTEESTAPQLPPQEQGGLPAGQPGFLLPGWQNMGVQFLFLLVTLLLLGNNLARLVASGTLEKDLHTLRLNMKIPSWILMRDWLRKNSLPMPQWLDRQAWMAGLNPLARAFTSIYTSLRTLKPAVSPALTPAEAAAELLTCLPEAGAEIQILLEEYQPAYYGTSPANLEKMRLAASSLRRKARQVGSAGLLNQRMNRSKFVDEEYVDEMRKTHG